MLYINELPFLYKLLYTNYCTSLTHNPITHYTNIEHVTFNFVDDSTNITSFKSFYIMDKYLEHFYKLLHMYYDINKLQINHDKNQLTSNGKTNFFL